MKVQSWPFDYGLTFLEPLSPQNIISHLGCLDTPPTDLPRARTGSSLAKLQGAIKWDVPCLNVRIGFSLICKTAASVETLFGCRSISLILALQISNDMSQLFDFMPKRDLGYSDTCDLSIEY